MQKRGAELNEQAAQNAYNRAQDWFLRYISPSARVKQLKDAGLSIGLMYGGGGANGMGAASSAPQGGASGGVGGGVGQAAMALPNININPADLAQARKLNAEAEVIEQYGGKEKEANIALVQAQEQVQKSQEELNKELAGDAKAHAEWQGVQTKIAQIDEQIKAASKEDVIQLAHEKVREMQAGIELVQEQAKHSKQEREKLMPAQTRWYNAQVNLLMQTIIEKQIENGIKRKTAEDVIAAMHEQARKAAAEANNEEDFIRRFDANMAQARRDNWFELGGDFLRTTSDIFTAVYGGKIGKAIATTPKVTSSGTNTDGSKWSWTRYGNNK